MRLLDKINIDFEGQQKSIELFHGDLSMIPAEHAVDVLVVSAFPNNYAPTSRSLIGALSRNGVSVAEYSRNKAIDLRANFSCWMSSEIKKQNFRRILCFEPYTRGNPAEVVGDIFQSLMPFVFANPPIKSIAIPLVASGDQGISIDQIFEPLVNAAVNWLMLGMPVDTIKIVEFDKEKANELLLRIKLLKQKLENKQISKSVDFKYDLFISYAHKNKDEILFVEKELKRLKPDIRIFLDLRDLNTGAAWQQELYEALDNCKRVVAFLSEPYLFSKICKEEFNIAVFRHRDSDEPVLLPIYLNSTNLPTYMKLIQFIDCREANKERLTEACKQIIEFIDQQ